VLEKVKNLFFRDLDLELMNLTLPANP